VDFLTVFTLKRQRFIINKRTSTAIKRLRTRSTIARQVSNAHERELVTNQNIWFRSFIGQMYLLESLFSNPVREHLHPKTLIEVWII